MRLIAGNRRPGLPFHPKRNEQAQAIGQTCLGHTAQTKRHRASEPSMASALGVPRHMASIAAQNVTGKKILAVATGSAPIDTRKSEVCFETSAVTSGGTTSISTPKASAPS